MFYVTRTSHAQHKLSLLVSETSLKIQSLETEAKRQMSRKFIDRLYRYGKLSLNSRHSKNLDVGLCLFFDRC